VKKKRKSEKERACEKEEREDKGRTDGGRNKADTNPFHFGNLIFKLEAVISGFLPLFFVVTKYEFRNILIGASLGVQGNHGQIAGVEVLVLTGVGLGNKRNARE